MSEKYAISLDVSIPQGTIKSGGRRKAAGDRAKFQFHKVRLKVAVVRVLTNGNAFQFHKVRLKGIYSHIIY